MVDGSVLWLGKSMTLSEAEEVDGVNVVKVGVGGFGWQATSETLLFSLFGRPSLPFMEKRHLRLLTRQLSQVPMIPLELTLHLILRI